ncbi:hypothetical protein BCD49_24295 [Pseudofrankia sp. EUN1h]|nr:hypothetical protein BCD49_24295 [Pseudofrankia sp. EUN1h]
MVSHSQPATDFHGLFCGSQRLLPLPQIRQLDTQVVQRASEVGFECGRVVDGQPAVDLLSAFDSGQCVTPEP